MKIEQVTVAVQCEDCTCEDETLSPASSTASSCSTCSSLSAEQQRNLAFLKRTNLAATIVRREPIQEEDEEDQDDDEEDSPSAIISV